jgi:hypothetical protein
MKSVLAGTGMAMAISVLGATEASAEAGTIKLSRDVVAPGGSVEITARCAQPGVRPVPVIPTTLRVTSPRQGNSVNELIALATVKTNTTPEIYQISVNCGGAVVASYLRVTRPKGAPETGGL